MFNAKEIKDLMMAQPFRPFRIWLLDGSHYEVQNHAAAFVTRNYVEVGVNQDPDGNRRTNRPLRHPAHPPD